MTRTMTAIIALGIFQILGLSTDYLTGNPVDSTESLADSAEQITWGISGLIVAAVLLVGVILRSPLVTALGGLCGFALYSMFAIHAAGFTLLNTPIDDWRVLTNHIGTALVWLVLAGSIYIRHKLGIFFLRDTKEEPS